MKSQKSRVMKLAWDEYKRGMSCDEDKTFDRSYFSSELKAAWKTIKRMDENKAKRLAGSKIPTMLDQGAKLLSIKSFDYDSYEPKYI